MRASNLLFVLAGVLPAGVCIAQELPGWKLTWSDEFNGTAVDTTKWKIINLAPNKNNEQEYYHPSHVSVANGLLTLKSTNQSTGGRPYTSGSVESVNKFFQLYGRFEGRMKMPKTQGIWPAFWLLPNPSGWPPEIDIMELLGHDPDTVYFSNHWGVWPTNSHQTTSYSGPDFAAGFHTFAVDWWPDRMEWYIDGFRRATHTQAVPNSAFFIILNTAVGGDWPGYPNGSTVFPQYFDIDYVRVYQPAYVNPGFESRGPNNTTLFGWTGFGNRFYDGALGYAGASSVKLFGNFSGSYNTSGVYQEVNVTPGKWYKVSGQWYTPSNDRIAGANTTSLILEWYTAGGALISTNSNPAIDATTPVNQWFKSQTQGFAPPNAAKVRFVVSFQQPAMAAGSSRTDEIDFREGTCPTDTNADGMTDDTDFVNFAAAYDQLVCGMVCPADFNGDTIVDDADFVLFVASYNDLLCP
ncbi:MAG: family 16 glycosylhydrolase [Phycisphaeraceae bacterium]|nr:family 16 glycosylhydrolase [Phycisphaeraceae bacterium]